MASFLGGIKDFNADVHIAGLDWRDVGRRGNPNDDLFIQEEKDKGRSFTVWKLTSEQKEALIKYTQAFYKHIKDPDKVYYQSVPTSHKFGANQVKPDESKRNPLFELKDGTVSTHERLWLTYKDYYTRDSVERDPLVASAAEELRSSFLGESAQNLPELDEEQSSLLKEAALEKVKRIVERQLKAYRYLDKLIYVYTLHEIVLKAYYQEMMDALKLPEEERDEALSEIINRRAYGPEEDSNPTEDDLRKWKGEKCMLTKPNASLKGINFGLRERCEAWNDEKNILGMEPLVKPEDVELLEKAPRTDEGIAGVLAPIVRKLIAERSAKEQDASHIEKLWKIREKDFKALAQKERKEELKEEKRQKKIENENSDNGIKKARTAAKKGLKHLTRKIKV